MYHRIENDIIEIIASVFKYMIVLHIENGDYRNQRIMLIIRKIIKLRNTRIDELHI